MKGILKIVAAVVLLALPAAVVMYLHSPFGLPAAIAAAHTLFLCILRFAPVREFIAADELRDYWDAEKGVERQINLPGKTYVDPNLKSCVKDIAQEPVVDRVSRAHFLTKDSILFVEGYEADLMQVIALNIILLVAIAVNPKARRRHRAVWRQIRF